MFDVLTLTYTTFFNFLLEYVLLFADSCIDNNLLQHIYFKYTLLFLYFTLVHLLRSVQK